jgi:hypothetical protein
MTHCQRCGDELASGSLKYLVTVTVTADFDGVLPTQVEMADLEAFMNQLDQEDPVRTEIDASQSQGYVLCPGCKSAFLNDPLGVKEDDSGGDDESGKVH